MIIFNDKNTFSSRLHGFFTSKPNESVGSRTIRRVIINIALLMAFAFPAADLAAQQIIHVDQLSSRPALNGSFDGWSAVSVAHTRDRSG